jgi:hypothetical protein
VNRQAHDWHLFRHAESVPPRFDDAGMPPGLRALGHHVREAGEGERILATAIIEQSTLTADGDFEPRLEGSSKPVAQKAGADSTDPKELARLCAAQMAKEAADRAAEKAADVAATKALESAAADAENALNDVAILYLKQIKAAMAGNFTFDVQREVTSNRTVGVKFEVKARHPVSITLVGGAIQVRIHTGGGMIYPEIKVPSDLSKEKLGALVQTIIEG